MTSRPGPDLPEGVRSVGASGLATALRALREAVSSDVWIVGGAKTARLCLEAGLVDELELYVVPRLLGDGIPLLARREALVELTLRETRAFANGVVMARYALGAHSSKAP